MAAEPTRHVRAYGIQIEDAAGYRRYREGMTPILHRHGGAFAYDLAVARVLASESDHRIDRVFTIAFPDRAAADRFFADPEYLAVRRTWFEPSVAAITAIAAFDEPAPLGAAGPGRGLPAGDGARGT
jgi:uncharacterized protein (DUF1330 family)